MSVPTNLIPTKITGLPEYQGTSVDGYLPYVIDGRTYKVRFGNIAAVGAVPSTRRVATGTGLAGGGDLSEDRTIYIPNGGVGDDQLSATGVTGGTYGSSTQIPIIIVDFKGRLTSASSVALEVPVLDLSDPSKTQGALPLGRGGTGSVISPAPGAIPYSTASSLALTSVGLAGQVLMSGGTGAPYWSTVTGTGTVTSVDASGGTTGLTFTGGPVTTVGTLTLGGTLAIAHGGTGATDAATARVNIGAAASGANSDITSMSGITGAIGTPDYIDFDTAATVTRATGRLWWDNADGNQTLSLGMAGSNATLQVGQEMYFRIRASAAITEGQGVMFTGTVGASGALTGAPASGLTKDTASYFMGVATEDIPINSWGYVTQFGLVRGINTTGGAEAWVDGQILYYNPAVPGGLTKTVPTAPAAKIEVAAVVHAASNGSIFVRPTARFSLGQLNDLETSAASDLDLLQYNGPSGLWQHKSPSLISVGSATNLAGGAANRIAYQTGAGATGFIVAPTVANTYLEWSGSAFQWSSNPLGTVTSVNASGGTTGLTFSGGPVTTAGTLTLGGTLAVASGGTGATSLTSGYLLKGNGTSAVSASVVYDDGTNVGIGTASPTSFLGKLTVIGNISTGTGGKLYQFDSSNSSGRYMQALANHGLAIGKYDAGDVEQVRIDSSGNVGIGTTSLGAKLTVVGTTKIGEGAASNTSKLMVNTLSGTAAGIQLFQDGNESWIIQNPASTTALTFANSGTERMRITSAGDVGIGLTPSHALDVYSAANGIIRVGGGNATNQGAAFYVKNANNSNTQAAFGDRARIFGGTPDQLVSIFTSALPLTFDVNGSERARFDTSGNLGIGVTPTAKLHVAGTIQSQSGSSVAQMYSDGGAAYLTSVNAFPLIFLTNGSERMRIDASGNVGIGMTPSYKLDVTASGSNIRAYTASGNAELLIQSGASGGAILDLQTSAGLNRIAGGVGSTSNMRFYTASTERMIIDSSGNMGVGTSSPEARLHVFLSSGVVARFGEASTGAVTNIHNRLAALPTTGTGTNIGWLDSGSGFAAGSLLLGARPSTGLVVLSSSGAADMVVNTSGNVGIGTSSSLSSGLTVARGAGVDATISLRGNGNGSAAEFSFTQASDGTSTYIQNRANGFMAFNTNNTERLRITAAGLVGVGTNSPTYRLHVSTSGVNALGVYRDLDVTSVGAAGQIIEIGAKDGATFTPGASITGVLNNPATTGYLSFETRAAGVMGERMRITSGGNLLLGTTASSGTPYILELNTASDTRIGIKAGNVLTGIIQATTNNFSIATSGASTVTTFSINGSEKMRIDASGNLNLGQAASALQSGGTGITLYGSTASEIKFLNSTTGATSTDGTALVASGSNFVVNNREAGAITLGTSNTERMRVASDGNVGIGNTNPQAVLHISGAQRIEHVGDRVIDFLRSGANTFSIEHDTARMYFYNVSTASTILAFDNASNVGVGTANPSSKLTVAGTIESTTGGVKFPDATTQTTKGIAAAWAQITSIATTSGTTAIFSNIPQTYTALRFAIVGVSHNGGTNGSIRMSVSSDGVTYSAAWNLGASIAAAATIDGALQGDSYTQDTCFFIGDAISSANASPYVSVNGTYFMFKVTGGVKYVKFEWSQGASFDAGSITLYGR